ncbi:MAG: alkyl hydroperoxide reductase [Planctomycetota bacterium]
MAQLRLIQERFPDQIAVIGVHSAKFPSERLTASIREAVVRHGIDHPVVNDAGFRIWNDYGVRAWPTVAFVDPRGTLLGAIPGEISAAELIPNLERMISEYERLGLIDPRPVTKRREKDSQPASVLQYPSKLIVTSEATMFVADTGHHRVIQLDLDREHRSARIVRVFGSGEAGFADGPGDRARFRDPHGLSRKGSTLYVADTENHAVRAIDLDRGSVRTVAGTGVMAEGRLVLGAAPTRTALRSPWAVWVDRPRVLVAMAGSHQVLSLEDETTLSLFAGSGREELRDGPGGLAGFNQPSDLSGNEHEIFVADSEASAVRRIALDGKAMVETVVGMGLFEFGDRDGAGDAVRLQHPTGLAWADHQVFVADSYNHKIKRLDPQTRKVVSLIGTGRPGMSDGKLREAMLHEPQGVAVRGRKIYVADTNNHAVRVADLDTLRVHTLEIA